MYNFTKQANRSDSARMSLSLPSKPLQQLAKRKRSRSLSSISSKQSSMEGHQQKRLSYKLSREHVILLIVQEQMRDQEVIYKNEALSQYYNCFNNLFKIIYLSAETVIKHSFYKGDQELGFGRLKIIGSLIGQPQPGWTLSKSSKLIILSQNIHELSKNYADFQRRIQYVSRKVCINKSRKAAFQNAFVNQNLKKSWQNIIKDEQFMLHNHFLLDMLESHVEKLCYLDIRRFTNKRPCRAEFRQSILRCCKKEEIDSQMELSFTFEFSLIEEFCLSDYLQSQAKPKPEKQQQKCRIM